MIPPLEDGVLPEGIHECTFEELERAFGQFQRSDRRINLIAKLKAYLDEARNSGLVIAAIIDGSFVTEHDPRFHQMLDFFQTVNPEKHHTLTSRTRKGVLRILL